MFLSIGFSDWLLSSPRKTQTEGKSIPYRSKFLEPKIWVEYGPNIASKSLTWINIGPT